MRNLFLRSALPRVAHGWAPSLRSVSAASTLALALAADPRVAHADLTLRHTIVVPRLTDYDLLDRGPAVITTSVTQGWVVIGRHRSTGLDALQLIQVDRATGLPVMQAPDLIRAALVDVAATTDGSAPIALYA